MFQPRQRLRIFLFCRKVMLRSQDIQVFVFLTILIFQICDVMMRISTWDTVHFLIYLLNHNSLTYQTWSFNRYKQGQYFSKIVWKISKTGAKFQALFNLATCSNYSITNYVKFAVIVYFESVNNRELKKVNINY